jgi:hypothetical protein
VQCLHVFDPQSRPQRETTDRSAGAKSRAGR